MPKRRTRRKPSRPAPGRPQPVAQPAPPDEPDVMDDVRVALDADEPLPLLALGSTMVQALDPGRRPPLERAAEPGDPTLDDLVAALVQVDTRETTALLAVVAELAGDDVLRQRLRREVVSRRQALPRWLAEISTVAPVDQVVEVAHVLGDGSNLALAVRLPGGHELSALVHVDHNLGGLVKDAFVAAEPLSDLVDAMAATADEDTSVTSLDPADARARVTEAVELGAMTYPPLETDSWPACRPLLEWAVRTLPAGGTGYQRPGWGPAELAALTERFFASPHGADCDDEDHRGLLEQLLWYGTDYGPGDPLRWSPTAVEIVLTDWLPRKVVADADFLAKAPGLLRALVRFSHAERGVRPALTTETLSAVDHFEPEYQATIRSPRPQGPAALLGALGDLGPLGQDDAGTTPLRGLTDLADIFPDHLHAAVGGEEALAALDRTPLPDEPFAWDLVPADVHGRVGEVLALTDRCCEELLDVEHRTACRRLLARVAEGDPQIFRRHGRPDTAAAALVWSVGQANHSFSGGTLTVKRLVSWFDLGQSTASTRAKVLLRAIGVEQEPYGQLQLGSPAYLTSQCREMLVTLRDTYRALVSEGGPGPEGTAGRAER